MYHRIYYCSYTIVVGAIFGRGAYLILVGAVRGRPNPTLGSPLNVGVLRTPVALMASRCD